MESTPLHLNDIKTYTTLDFRFRGQYKPKVKALVEGVFDITFPMFS